MRRFPLPSHFSTRKQRFLLWETCNLLIPISPACDLWEFRRWPRGVAVVPFPLTGESWTDSLMKLVTHSTPWRLRWKHRDPRATFNKPAKTVIWWLYAQHGSGRIQIMCLFYLHDVLMFLPLNACFFVHFLDEQYWRQEHLNLSGESDPGHGEKFTDISLV